MVLALEGPGAAVLQRERPAAVAADVEEGAEHAVPPAHHDHRIVGHRRDEVLALLRHLRRMPDVLPGPGKDQLAVDRVETRVGVPRGRNGVRTRKRRTRERGGVDGCKLGAVTLRCQLPVFPWNPAMRLAPLIATLLLAAAKYAAMSAASWSSIGKLGMRMPLNIFGRSGSTFLRKLNSQVCWILLPSPRRLGGASVVI